MNKSVFSLTYYYMKNRLLHSLLASSLSIIPIIGIVVLLSTLPLNNGIATVALTTYDYLALAIGAFVLILGLTIFQIGATRGLTQVGQYMGSSLSKQTHLFVVIIFAFLLGALITCAEPSILIVSGQVNINPILLIGMIAVGVGIFVVIGVLRIIFYGSLKVWYLFFYFITFSLMCLIAVDNNSRQFLPFIFDAGGITTGSATVPFILALGAGIATVRGKNIREDSFGVVGMASIGPIITMTMLLLFARSGFEPYVVSMPKEFNNIGDVFYALQLAMLPQGGGHIGTLIEVLMATAPILLIFFIYQFIYIKLPKQKIGSILTGFGYSYIGLVIFLTGVSAIMTSFGTKVGMSLGTINNDWMIILICFIIGLVTILCEPAVHVLTTQINEVSEDTVKKSTVLMTLSIGVGVAIGLAAIRTLFNFDILWIVVPGYIISIILMFIAPNLYTAMAFDAGGTASGPMSVSFVLPMMIGLTKVKYSFEAESVAYYTQSFGVVALIALTPIIAVQFLGVFNELKKYRMLRVMRNVVYDISDSEIIHFR